MIAALKQLYERHSNDLAKLKKTYEQHAEECAHVAELTVDPGRREVYLNLAREWAEAAAAVSSNAIGAAALNGLGRSARRFGIHFMN